MSYSPPGESAAALLNEKSTLIGAIVTAAAYGVHFTLFFLCFWLLWKERYKTPKTYFFLAYISFALTLGTYAVAISSLMTQYAFIDYRNYPGSPSAFAARQFSFGIETVGEFSSTIGNWCVDAIIVWRGLTIYRGTRLIWIMAVPVLLFISAFAMSIRFFVEITKRNVTLLAGTSTLMPYIVLSQSLNITVSILIVARLLVQRRKFVNVLTGEHAQHYVSIAAMIVESASLSAVFAVTYLILYILNHPVQGVFLNALNQVVFIAPLLIIYRVAQGRAWSPQTSSVVSATQFQPHPNSNLRIPTRKYIENEIPAAPQEPVVLHRTTDNYVVANSNISFSSIFREDAYQDV